MNSSIANLRLLSQQLVHPRYYSPKELIQWMGAVQAQDCSMAKWAMGIRLGNCAAKDVEIALDKGEILRTHILRPTWHFVAPENIRWMLSLSSKRIIASSKSRDAELGINQDTYERANEIIAQSLKGGRHLTKDAIAEIIEWEGLPSGSSCMIHYLMRAEAEGLICSGAMQGRNHTYALLDERAPASAPIDKDEALAKLARLYFISHGPATLADYTWWSGLSVTEARRGLEAAKSSLCEIVADGSAYYYSEQYSEKYSSRPTVDEPVAHLLPAYDEYIISYKDRTPVLSSSNHSKVISTSGIFRPVVLINGIVKGLWKKKSAVDHSVSIDFFDYSPDITQGRMLHDAIDGYKGFWGGERETPVF